MLKLKPFSADNKGELPRGWNWVDVIKVTRVHYIQYCEHAVYVNEKLFVYKLLYLKKTDLIIFFLAFLPNYVWI